MTRSDSSRAGFLPARVVHLHPSRFCNLACRHCYSESSPYLRAALRPEVLVAALTTLRAEGYEVLSLSGGEPLLYAGFEAVVREAAALGYRINLISNGAPVGGRLLDLTAEYIDLIAISLDGAPDTHTMMRNDPQAFKRAERAMERLAERKVRFGISYCVSHASLPDMPWAVEFAAAKGAALVQFHPFAAVGRGATLGEAFGLDAADKARAYVVATLLNVEPGPTVQLDLAPVAAALTRRDDYAVIACDDAQALPLSDVINPLVIDDLGRIVPLSYGIAPRFALGSIHRNIPADIARYKTEGWQQLRILLNAAFAELYDTNETLIDWFHHVVATSYRITEVARAIAAS